MKVDDKDRKNFDLKTAAKGATLAAMVAALGISLGTEVKNVYAQENDLNSGSKLKLEGALALKIDTGGSQELKLEDTQQGKIEQSVSGRIVSVSGNRLTLRTQDNKLLTFPVLLNSGADAVDMFRVGDLISGKIVNGQLVPVNPSR